MSTYTWIATSPGDYASNTNWSPTGTPTTAGDVAQIGPGAQVALTGTLTGATVRLSADTGNGNAGVTPQLGISNASLRNTVIETAGSGTFSGVSNADIALLGAVTNAGTIIETPYPGYGGDLSLSIADGGVFTNDGTIAGNAYGTLDLSGLGSANFVNDGVVSGDGTSMLIDTPITGTGQINLMRGPNPGSHWGSQTTLEATGAVSAGQTIAMQTALLRLDQPLAFHGTISATGVLPASSGSPENTIQLPGVTATSDSVQNNTLYVYGGTSLLAQIAIDPSIAGDDFALATGTLYQGGGSGTAISILPEQSDAQPAGSPTGTAATSPDATGSATTPPTVSQSTATPPSDSSPLSVLDTSTGKPLAATPTPFSVPAAGLNDAYVNLTPDNLAVSASTPGWFIYTGSGNDMITVDSGNNVIDGGGGSNFLKGGTGTDVFFVDDQNPTAPVWSTLDNFHSGDSAVVLGVSPKDFTTGWFDGQGSPGYTGLTLHANAPSGAAAALTLSGYTSADLQNGRLQVAFGNNPAAGGGYMLVHAA